MTSLMARDKTEAKKKGFVALSAAAASAGLLVINAPIVLTGAAVGATAYFTYKWFMFRAKRGMRF
jgi:hypothetical protein